MSPSKSVKLNTGQEMPIIGLGTGGKPADTDIRDALRVALEHGYRLLDTAYLYWTEEEIGDVLQELISQGKLRREDVFVTSKLPAIANRAEDVNRFLTMSLKKLKLDYVDQYLIHHPFGLKNLNDNNVFAKDVEGVTQIDFDTDLEKIWKALEVEVKAGRVKSLGLSNFNRDQTERILKIAEFPPAASQFEIHAYFPQLPLVDFLRKRGIAAVAYCPLGGPWTSEGKSMNLLEDPIVLELAQKYRRTTGQILLRFLTQRGIIVIPKSFNPKNIKANFDIMDFELSDSDMGKLFSLDKGAEGRIFHFKSDFNGCENHKEYPFHAKF